MSGFQFSRVQVRPVSDLRRGDLVLYYGGRGSDDSRGLRLRFDRFLRLILGPGAGTTKTRHPRLVQLMEDVKGLDRFGNEVVKGTVVCAALFREWQGSVPVAKLRDGHEALPYARPVVRPLTPLQRVQEALHESFPHLVPALGGD